MIKILKICVCKFFLFLVKFFFFFILYKRRLVWFINKINNTVCKQNLLSITKNCFSFIKTLKSSAEDNDMITNYDGQIKDKNIYIKRMFTNV